LVIHHYALPYTVYCEPYTVIATSITVIANLKGEAIHGPPLHRPVVYHAWYRPQRPE